MDMGAASFQAKEIAPCKVLSHLKTYETLKINLDFSKKAIDKHVIACYNKNIEREVITIDLKDSILIVLTVWANVIATTALIHTIRKDKRNTAPKRRPKHLRKR